MTTNLKIEGMMCDNCKRHVETALTALPGVSSVEVDRPAGIATVEHDDQTAPGALAEAATEEGYPATLLS